MTNRAGKIYHMVIAALLCAVGIVIPIFSPLKIVLEPASFTLASHVAIFIAMFISPVTAAAVSAITTLGFFLGGFPLVIVARAATHLIFSVCGALILKRKPQILDSVFHSLIFSLLISTLHGICEVLIVSPFYFGSAMTQGWYAKGFMISVILLVGVGTVVHSMVDFWISMLIWRPLRSIIRPALERRQG